MKFEWITTKGNCYIIEQKALTLLDSNGDKVTKVINQTTEYDHKCVDNKITINKNKVVKRLQSDILKFDMDVTNFKSYELNDLINGYIDAVKQMIAKKLEACTLN